MDLLSGLASVESLMVDSHEGLGALESLKAMVQQAKESGVPASHLRFDPLLARGLDYYTGAIFLRSL